MSLTEFLLARIAEDEEGGAHVHDDRCAIFDYDGMTANSCDCGEPARAMAECEAKRRIVAMHPGATENDECPGCHADLMGRWITGPREVCPMLGALAAVYADHPDYQQEWKP